MLSTGQCKSCASKCATCTGSKKSDCTKCESGYVLDDVNACRTSCPTGY
jgi:hypothetical protein